MANLNRETVTIVISTGEHREEFKIIDGKLFFNDRYAKELPFDERLIWKQILILLIKQLQAAFLDSIFSDPTEEN